VNIKISTGERVELMAPGASYTGCAIHIATAEADRNICEVTVENGRVAKIFLRTSNGAWEQVFDERSHPRGVVAKTDLGIAPPK
jgi:hypothetical protein